ncbi:hypothetical protein ELQ35_18820 [Peribacillus cavernae]|uniref:Uncharacterized protein n=1 Tax=Peribacillus cavernae TaxID=1674310 RepID=A0A3S0VJ29_9BACI|nr:hypothetical protein [Peribacillus cavernae]MDQ0219586.1 capsule polysaccharide modification protein KpsS [Peribacillus cavernae]RUQ25876.1 hypothetical protein ELQ35_18820 [Peribacillus cavernae]
MSGSFFADYKKFIVLPEEEVSKEEFDPQNYATFYIVTLSLYDSLLTNWREANKYEIEVEKSIETVLEEFNRKQRGIYNLQILELESDNSYFVLALSCKSKIENEEANDRISHILEKILSNPFYIGQGWYKLIGEKGRIERKLFCFSFKEYMI